SNRPSRARIHSRATSSSTSSPSQASSRRRRRAAAALGLIKKQSGGHFPERGKAQRSTRKAGDQGYREHMREQLLRVSTHLPLDFGFFHRVDGFENFLEGPGILGAEEATFGHFRDFLQELDVELRAHPGQVA